MGNSVNLISGEIYEVIKPFKDFDGINHPVGERWTYIGTNFLPYDDGLTLHVHIEGREVVYRFWWFNEGQGEIVDHFNSYVSRLQR